MPANKNALTRIVLLDKLLADRYHSYSIQDMTDVINRQLPEYGQKDGVTKRCVEKDIEYLEYKFPELIEFERYTIDAYSVATDKPYRKRCIRYADPTFSIFKGKLSEEEKGLLSAALSTIGSFEGLDSFGWLNDFSKRLGLVEQEPIIQMSKNLLENKTLMAEAFSAIQAKSVVNIEYVKYNDSQKRKVIISPYLLKEYNRRWYIIGAAYDTGKILNFALDRILSIKVLTGFEYNRAPDDLNERYEDIIGITYDEESPLHKIIFWVSDSSVPYIRTKPLHGSQKELKGEKENALREQYSLPEAGALFTIECRKNYELIRELTSFTDLKILSPEPIINAVKTRIKNLYQNYF
ncbi:MAG: WYL domain-containing protein [Duncaniella sp.]|nr:WYL domain-containing protein [Duncaniella sp.]